MEVRSIEVIGPGQTEPTRYRSIEVRAAIGEVRDHPDRTMSVTFADGSVMRLEVLEIVGAEGRTR